MPLFKPVLSSKTIYIDTNGKVLFCAGAQHTAIPLIKLC